jgi:predicted ATP-dependent protease
VPAGNLPELSEIPDHMRQRIKIKPVTTMAEVLSLALARPLAPGKWHGEGAGRSNAKGLPQSRRGGAA